MLLSLNIPKAGGVRGTRDDSSGSMLKWPYLYYFSPNPNVLTTHTYGAMDVLINLIVVILSQCINILNRQVVHLYLLIAPQ